MYNLLTFLLLLITIEVAAQKIYDTVNFNGIQLRIGHNQIKEQNLHPKVNRGFILSVGYVRIAIKQNISKVGLAFSYSKVKTRYEDHASSTNIQLTGNYEYLFRIRRTGNLRLFFGPQVKLHYNLSLFPNFDESHLYWADYLSVGLSHRMDYNLGNHRLLVLNVSLPLISFFSRPEFSRQFKIDNVSAGGILSNMHSNISFGSWNRNIFTDVQLEYQCNTNQRLVPSFFYAFNFARLKHIGGNPFNNINHFLGAKLYF